MRLWLEVRGLIEVSKCFNELNGLFSHLLNIGVSEYIALTVKYALARKYGLKTDVNGKMLKQIFDHYGYFKAFLNLKFKNLDKIVVTENYTVLGFTFKGKPRWGNYVRVYSYSYIIGVNSETGKLWIVRVATGTVEILEAVKFKETTIFIGEDKIVRAHMLNYSYDIDYETLPPLKELEVANIRVQGDLLLHISTVGSNAVNHYMQTLEDEISLQLRRRYESEIVRKVAELMETYGLNCETESDTVNIPCLRKNTGREERIKRMKIIAKIVFEKLYLEDVFKELKIGKVEKRKTTVEELGFPEVEITYSVEGEDFLKITVFDRENTVFGQETYDSICVSIYLEKTALKHRVREIVEEIRENGYLSFGKTKLRIGRHRVECTALPLALNIQTEILGENVYFRISGLPLVVKGEVEITHPEHLTKKLYFNEPCEVDFTTIRNDISFLGRLNKYIIDGLAEKHS